MDRIVNQNNSDYLTTICTYLLFTSTKFNMLRYKLKLSSKLKPTFATVLDVNKTKKKKTVLG